MTSAIAGLDIGALADEFSKRGRRPVDRERLRREIEGIAEMYLARREQPELSSQAQAELWNNLHNHLTAAAKVYDRMTDLSGGAELTSLLLLSGLGDVGTEEDNREAIFEEVRQMRDRLRQHAAWAGEARDKNAFFAEHSKGGRPRNIALRLLIFALAQVYERHTGHPAGTSHDRMGGPRGGPFVRFAEAVHALLEPQAPRSALGQTIRGILAERRSIEPGIQDKPNEKNANN